MLIPKEKELKQLLTYRGLTFIILQMNKTLKLELIENVQYSTVYSIFNCMLAGEKGGKDWDFVALEMCGRLKKQHKQIYRRE